MLRFLSSVSDFYELSYFRIKLFIFKPSHLSLKSKKGKKKLYYMQEASLLFEM